MYRGCGIALAGIAVCATHLHGLDCRCVDRRCNRIGCLLCDICVSVVFFALLGPTVVVLLCSGVYEEQAPLGGGAAIELFKNSFLLLVAMPLLLVASGPEPRLRKLMVLQPPILPEDAAGEATVRIRLNMPNLVSLGKTMVQVGNNRSHLHSNRCDAISFFSSKEMAEGGRRD